MKSILLVLLFISTSFAQDQTPAVWGKIFKTKSETYGYQYFVYFKKDGKDYAYPLASSSKITLKELDSLSGKYAQIYGTTRFEKTEIENLKHIMTFDVSKVKELSLADLNQNLEKFDDRLDMKKFTQHKQERTTAPGMKISDKVANTAIIIGGSILAAEILGKLLSH